METPNHQAPELSRQEERRSLKTLFSVEPYPIEQALSLMRRVLEALEEVHRSRRFHPDLTPSVIEMNGRDQVTVRSSSHRPPQEGTRALPQPQYSAPETLCPEMAASQELHERTDLYVLGYIFYELLCGSELFDRQFKEIRDSASPAYHWFEWHSDEDRRPSELRELLPDCPPRLSDLLVRMMEKEPERRVESVAQAVEEVQAIEEDLRWAQNSDIPTVIASQSRSPHRHEIVEEITELARERNPRIWLLLILAALLVAITAWLSLRLLAADPGDGPLRQAGRAGETGGRS